MKRLISFLLCTALLLPLLGMPASAIQDEFSQYEPFIANGNEISGGVYGGGEFNIKADIAPFIKDGRTFLPIRFVALAFGMYTTWDNNSKTVTLERGTTTVRLSIGSKVMTINRGRNESLLQMDVAPMLRNGRTVLPVRFVAEAFGLKVEWEKAPTIEYHYDTFYLPGRISITEGLKELNLYLGNTALDLVGGHFLRFCEIDDFRFAYPLLPSVEKSNLAATITFNSVDLPEGNIITLNYKHLYRLNRSITVRYEPVADTIFSDMNLESVIDDIAAQHSASVYHESATICGIPAIAYGLISSTGRRPLAGIAFFHNNMLMRFEVLITVDNVQFGSDKAGIAEAKYTLDELVTTLMMKDAQLVH